MKKILFATVALLVVGAAAPAVGADLGNRNYYKSPAPAYAAPIYNWTGFYIGGHVGGAFSSDNNFNGLSTGNNGNGRFLGGLQAGADWQFNPNFVVGVEGQYSWLVRQRRRGVPGRRRLHQRPARSRLDHRPRRLHLGSGLLYVKGGYAYSDNNEKVTVRRRADRLHHHRRPPQRLHRRRRPRIHVRAELVRQGRVPVLQFRRRALHRGPAGGNRQLHAPTTTPSRRASTTASTGPTRRSRATERLLKSLP